jgi:hypothetical protein
MTAFSTSNPGKAIIEDAAIKITVYYLFHVGAKETILPSEKIIIDLLKSLKMILKTLIIC